MCYYWSQGCGFNLGWSGYFSYARKMWQGLKPLWRVNLENCHWPLSTTGAREYCPVCHTCAAWVWSFCLPITNDRSCLRIFTVQSDMQLANCQGLSFSQVPQQNVNRVYTLPQDKLLCVVCWFYIASGKSVHGLNRCAMVTELLFHVSH